MWGLGFIVFIGFRQKFKGIRPKKDLKRTPILRTLVRLRWLYFCRTVVKWLRASGL